MLEREKDYHSPVDDAFIQLRESLDGLGKMITNLDERLCFVTNKHSLSSDDVATSNNGEKTSSDVSPLLSQIQVFNYDVKIKRDYVMTIIEKLDI